MKLYLKIFIVVALLFVITSTACLLFLYRNANKFVIIKHSLHEEWDRFEITAKYPYNKNIKIEESLIKDIIKNIDDKTHPITSSIPINIKIFIKGDVKPLEIIISRSGWGTSTHAGDCYSYKNQILGRKYHDEIYGKLQSYYNEGGQAPAKD